MKTKESSRRSWETDSETGNNLCICALLITNTLYCGSGCILATIVLLCRYHYVPGTVGHLDGWALALVPTTSGHRSVAWARPTCTAADGALAVIVVTGLPRGPRTKATILCQVPHLWRWYEKARGAWMSHICQNAQKWSKIYSLRSWNCVSHTNIIKTLLMARLLMAIKHVLLYVITIMRFLT